MLLFNLPIMATVFSDGYLKYEANGDTAIVKGYTSLPEDGHLVIPSTVDYSDKTYQVTTVKAYAFQDCIELKSVIIPTSIRNIERYAFVNCINLNTIDILDSNEGICIDETAFEDAPITSAKIGRDFASKIFYEHKTLKDVIFGPYITFIRDNYFNHCKTLQSVSAPNVETIGIKAFFYCESLLSIDCPKVTRVLNMAFDGCQKLGKIFLPNVLAIHKDAFCLTGITELDIPSVESIGESAFSSCSKLITVKMPKVTNLGRSAFSSCRSLKTIELPRVTKIPVSAFQYCDSLNIVSLSDSLKMIENSAFYECKSLKSIYIPNSCYNIGNSVFERCTNLQSVHLPSELSTISKDLFATCKSLTILDASNTQVGRIFESAFAGCSSLISIILPMTLHTIDANVFSGDTNLETIVGLDSVAYLSACGLEKTKWYSNQIKDNKVIIGKAFYRYEGTIEDNNFVVPEGIVCLSDNALRGQNFKTIQFPSSLKRIGDNALSDCQQLAILTIPANVIKIGKIDNCASLSSLRIYGDSSSYNSYVSSITNTPIKTLYINRITYGFSKITTISRLTIGPLVESISQDLSYSQNIADLEIEDATTPLKILYLPIENVRSLYMGRDVTFENYSNVKRQSFINVEDLTFGPYVRNIADDLFKNNNHLTSVVMGDGVLTIGEDAFSECPNLKTVHFNEGLQRIGGFRNCNIDSLEMPNSVIECGYFDGNPIKHLKLSENLEKIPAGAFYNHCIDTLIIPTNVRIVEEYAFASREHNMDKLILNEKLEEIKYGAFKFYVDSVILLSPNIKNSYTMEGAFDCRYAEARCKKLPDIFSSSTHLEKVVLRDGVEELCENAFCYCRNLKEVHLPSTLKKIEHSAFGATDIHELTIPASVTEIGFGILRSNKGDIRVTLLGDNNSPTLTIEELDATYLYTNRNCKIVKDRFDDPTSCDTLVLGPNVKEFLDEYHNPIGTIICLNNEISKSVLDTLSQNTTPTYVLPGFPGYQEGTNYQEIYHLDNLEYDYTGNEIEVSGINNLPFTILPKFYQSNAETVLKNKGDYALGLEFKGSPFDGIYPTYLTIKVCVPEGINLPQNEETYQTKYYDLNGREIPSTHKGIFIKKMTYKDGSSKTVKVRK